MQFGEICGIIAGILSFSAYLFYIIAIVRGRTKPSRATWFIAAFSGIIIVASYKASGAENTIWVAVSEAIAPILIGILAIKYGIGGSRLVDVISFIGALISLFLWWYFGSPVIALLANLSIDFFAAVPTIVKSWYKPKQEDRFAWTLTQVGNTFNLLAIDKLSFGVIIYPIYIFAIDGIITGLLYKSLFKKRRK